MPPTTVEALGLLLIAVLPGAVYVWAFEREAGPFGVTLGDRVLRFVSTSLLLHAVFAWPLYLAWRLSFRPPGMVTAGRFAVLWIAALVVLLLAATAGSIVGTVYATRGKPDEDVPLRRRLRFDGERGNRRLAQTLHLLLGRAPAPRAWDSLFAERPDGFFRVLLPDDEFVVGRFAKRSYAAGYPAAPDLLLEDVYAVDDDGNVGDALGYAVYLPTDVIKGIELLGSDDVQA